MPMLGFGTHKLIDDEGYDQVLLALRRGYRLIDTASVYKNEVEVGKAIKDSGVPREEVFVVTKLHPRSHGKGKAYEAAAASLERLGLDYVE
jgi:diketogulonate reductase-like aldo/keto reductase